MTTTSTLFDSIAADVEGRSAATVEPTSSVAATATKAARRRRIADDAGPGAAAIAAARRDMKAAAPDAAPLDADRVGALVWWTTTTESIAVDAHRLWSALHAIDDDADDGAPRFAGLVKTPATPAMAIRRAAARRQSVLKEDGLRWHDLGTDAGGNVVVGLGEESANADARTWRGTCRFVVVVDAVTGAVERPDDLDDEDEARVSALLQRYDIERGNLTAQDIGALLTTVLLDVLGGFRVKHGGGVYFIPRDADASVARIAPALALAGVELLHVPVGKLQGRAFAGHARTALLDDIARLTEAARAAEAKATEAFVGGEVAPPKMDAQIARLEALREIKDRAALLEGLLGGLALDVKAATEAAEKATRETLALLPLCAA